MIRLIRTTASLLVASLFTAIALVWLQVPHHGAPNPTREIGVTYDGAVGMIDLYWRHDVRGYERLVDIDPQLNGIGGRAARAAATDPYLDVADRANVARRLSTQRGGLTPDLAYRIVESTDTGQLSQLLGFDRELDAAVDVALTAALEAELATVNDTDPAS